MSSLFSGRRPSYTVYALTVVKMPQTTVLDRNSMCAIMAITSCTIMTGEANSTIWFV
jgi:hypothetical protein